MGTFTILFMLFLLGLTPFFDSLEMYSTSLGLHGIACNIASSKQVIHHKYLSQRIPYYCNSTQTFQLHLLISGDVNPNPGPEPVLPKPASLHTGRVTYNRDELLQLNHAHASVSSYTSHSSILIHMKYLGILQHQYKKRLAHRGKERRSSSVWEKATFIIPDLPLHTTLLPLAICLPILLILLSALGLPFGMLTQSMPKTSPQLYAIL